MTASRMLLTALLLMAAARPSLRASEAEPPEPKAEDVRALVREFTGQSEAKERDAEQLAAAYAKVVEALIPEMGADDPANRGRAQGTLERICHRAGRPGAESHRLAVCKVMAARLGPKTPVQARIWLLRMLQYVGRAEAVPAIVGLLKDKEPRIGECARRALQGNTSQEAAAALRAELAAAKDPAWRVALINALGYRRDAACAAALARLLDEEEDAVAVAAASALGKIGGRRAAGALAAARGRGSPKRKRVVTDAYLLCADRLLAAGRNPEAAEIYRQLHKPAEPARVRIAAARGLAAAEPGKAAPLVMALLKDEDPRLRASATILIRELPGRDLTRAFAAELGKLDLEAQPAMLAALADRGDPAAAPAVIELTGSNEQPVRVAALEALGALGDASHVPLLARAGAAGGAKETAAARRSLNRLRGGDVDRTIVAELQEAETKVRVVLIDSLGARRARSAVPALLTTADDTDESVRTAALGALGLMAGEAHLPFLAGRLAKATGDRERAAARKAIISTCGRIPDKQRCAPAVLAVMKSATPPGRCALLRVLVHVPTAKALEAVRTSLKDADEQVHDAAVRALADWPETAALDDLLAVAREASSQTHKVLALRGYVRLLGLPAQRTSEETARLYEEAMKLADRADEKKLILGGLANVGHLSALKLVQPCMEDEALAAEAETAAVKIAAAIAGAEQELAVTTLEKIVETTQHEAIRKQAGEALSRIHKYRDYILTWMLAGPYLQKGKDGGALLAIPFDPERADARSVKWRQVSAGGDPGKAWMVDLRRAMGGQHRAAYLRVRVQCPAEQQAWLELGSDDGVKVWLNGEVVHTNNPRRGIAPGQDRVKVALRRGANTLMLKVVNHSGPWAACARIVSDKAKPIQGLKVTAE